VFSFNASICFLPTTRVIGQPDASGAMSGGQYSVTGDAGRAQAYHRAERGQQRDRN